MIIVLLYRISSLLIHQEERLHLLKILIAHKCAVHEAMFVSKSKHLLLNLAPKHDFRLQLRIKALAGEVKEC